MTINDYTQMQHVTLDNKQENDNKQSSIIDYKYN